MGETTVRGVGLTLAICYGGFITWLYIRQPQTIAQVTGGLLATVGMYRIDQQAFEDGMRLFERDELPAARAAFHRADPGQQDPRTQFLIAYTYYREGWGRVYNDDRLFSAGLAA